ncbi:hypothetical protein DFJ74DRAFT_660913 [Hyaloraphidium curvatum]|nr:hypothetical protein DFJ74DRAFT_660913 [Hyaloraphidium curvatum]
MGVGGSGSGKTHSLFGNPNEPGILFSTLDAIKKAIPGVLFDTEELTDFYAYMKPESLGHLMDTSGKGPISVLKPEIADAIQLPGCLSRDQVFSESVVQFGYDHLRGKHVLTPDIAKVASKPVQRRELSLTVPLLFDPALEPLRTLTRTTATSLIDSLNGGNGVVAFEHFQTARERCGFAKPTPNNPHSSRSSLFWTISVVSTHSNHTLGRITVIDAAGSENPTDIINSYLQSVRPLDRFPGDLRVLAGNPAASQIVLEGVMINETVAHTKRLLWKQSPIAEVRREADRAFWKGYRQQLIGGLRDKRGIRTGYQPSWALFWDSGRILSVSRLAEIFAGSRVKINLLGCIAPSRSKRAQTFNTLDFCNSVQTGAVEAFSTTTHVSRCVGSRCGHPGVVERFIHAVFFG